MPEAVLGVGGIQLNSTSYGLYLPRLILDALECICLNMFHMLPGRTQVFTWLKTNLCVVWISFLIKISDDLWAREY